PGADDVEGDASLDAGREDAGAPARPALGHAPLHVLGPAEVARCRTRGFGGVADGPAEADQVYVARQGAAHALTSSSDRSSAGARSVVMRDESWRQTWPNSWHSVLSACRPLSPSSTTTLRSSKFV